MYSASHKTHNWVKTLPCPQRPVWLAHRNRLWPCLEKWVEPDEPHGFLSTWTIHHSMNYLEMTATMDLKAGKKCACMKRSCFLTCQNKTRRQWPDRSALWSSSPSSYSSSVAISLQSAAMVQSQEACHWSNLLSPLRPRAYWWVSPERKPALLLLLTFHYEPHLLWFFLLPPVLNLAPVLPRICPLDGFQAEKSQKPYRYFMWIKHVFAPKDPPVFGKPDAWKNTHWDTASSGEEINSQPAQSTWQNSRDGRLLSKVGGESPCRADSLPPKHPRRKPVICVLWA